MDREKVVRWLMDEGGLIEITGQNCCLEVRDTQWHI